MLVLGSAQCIFLSVLEYRKHYLLVERAVLPLPLLWTKNNRMLTGSLFYTQLYYSQFIVSSMNTFYLRGSTLLLQ